MRLFFVLPERSFWFPMCGSLTAVGTSPLVYRCTVEVQTQPTPAGLFPYDEHPFALIPLLFFFLLVAC